ncbi:hypothetical protein PENTCL1PPCAC_14500, partial [Pristionchus entomophagus]
GDLKKITRLSYFIPLQFDNMRCCFGIFPITLGTMIVAGILVVAGAGSIVAEMLYSTPHVIWLRIGLMVAAVVQLVAAFLVFIACIRRQASLLMPIVIFIVLMMMVHVVKLVLSIIALIAPNMMTAIIIATPLSTAITAVLLILYAWFFHIFNVCFKYLE